MHVTFKARGFKNGSALIVRTLPVQYQQRSIAILSQDVKFTALLQLQPYLNPLKMKLGALSRDGGMPQYDRRVGQIDSQSHVEFNALGVRLTLYNFSLAYVACCV